jgi:hypothetical protein
MSLGVRKSWLLIDLGARSFRRPQGDVLHDIILLLGDTLQEAYSHCQFVRAIIA